MALSARAPSRVYWAGLLVLWLACLFVYSLPGRARVWQGKNDFAQLYDGGRLVGTPGLYSVDANEKLQFATLGMAQRSVCYSRLPFYAFLLKPLSALPYQAAFVLFTVLSAAAFWGFLWLFVPRARDLAEVGALSLPVIANLCMGNDVTFVLLAAGLSVLAARRGWDFCAGLLMAAGAIKFHLFLLAPIAVAMHRRWRILQGGVAGAGVLLGLSFVAQGWHWPGEYLALLRNPELSPHPDQMPTIRGLFVALGVDGPTAWGAALLAGITLFALVARRVPSYELAFGLSLAGGVLLSLHGYLPDCALLLLPFALVLEAGCSARLKSTMMLATLPPVNLMAIFAAPWVAGVPVVLMGVLGLAGTERWGKVGAAAGASVIVGGEAGTAT